MVGTQAGGRLSAARVPAFTAFVVVPSSLGFFAPGATTFFARFMFGSGCSFRGLAGPVFRLLSAVGFFGFVAVIRSRRSIDGFCARFRNNFRYRSEPSLKPPTKCQRQRFDRNFENQERLADKIVATTKSRFGPRVKIALAGHKHN